MTEQHLNDNELTYKIISYLKQNDLNLLQLDSYLELFDKYAERFFEKHSYNQYPTAHQLAKSIALDYFYQEEQEASNPESSSKDGKHKLFDRSTHQAFLENMHSRERSIINSYFNVQDDSGYRKLKKATIETIDVIRSLKKTYLNCYEFLEYLEKQVTLCAFNKHKELTFPPVLLIGPPGIGKTSVIRKLGQLLGLPYEQIDCGTLTGSFVISGGSAQWNGGRPGKISTLMKGHEYANPLIVFDEIDKMSSDRNYDPYAPLHTLLDKDANTKFVDEFINHLSIDVSKCSFFLTANYIEQIPKTILSRLTVIEIHDITDEQHITVTDSIYKDLLSEIYHRKEFHTSLSELVVETLRGQSPRKIKQTLQSALASAAHKRALSHSKEIIRISLEDIEVLIPADSANPIGFLWG